MRWGTRTCGRRTAAVDGMLCLAWTTFAAAGLVKAGLVTAATDGQPQLASRVSIQLDGVSLRDVTRQISRTQQVTILLDRRIDPDQTVRLNLHDVPLRRMLDQLADQHGAAIGQVGTLVYLGPRATASRLATLDHLRLHEVRQLPSSTRSKWLRPTTVRWNRLETPRNIIGRLLPAGTQANLNQIPHDLWDAGELPTLPVASALTALLAGFHVTFDFVDQGQTVRWRSIPVRVAWTQTYADLPDGTIAAMTARFPMTRTERNGKRVKVTGPIESHWLITQRPTASPGSEKATARQEFTLKVVNKPLDDVLAVLAQRTGRSIVWASRTETARTQLVTLNATNLSLQRLVEAAAGQAGLQAEVFDDRMVIRLRPKTTPAPTPP